MSRGVFDLTNINKFILFLAFSCIAFYTLFLSIPKGYVYGALLALMVAIFSISKWKYAFWDKEIKYYFLFLVFFGFFMAHSFEGFFSFSNEGDFLTKYVLGGFILLGAAVITLPPKVFAYSVAIGCCASAVLAGYQFPILGRAEGYTNAIRFGNISMLMAVICFIFVFSKNFRSKEKLFLLVSGLAGTTASILSLSRGGWLIIFLIPFVSLFFVDNSKSRKKIYLGGLFASAVLALCMTVIPVAQQRFLQAKNEASGYLENPSQYATTSVGARLEQWRLSWNLGWEKPFSGWGVQSIDIGRKAYIDRGDAHPFMVHINHTHNEFLEIWATRGILGVMGLLIFYLLPLFIFWPTKEKISNFSEENRSIYIALGAIGVMISVSYFIFGLTDVFFNLAIGHNFFVFTTIFLLSSIQWIKKNDTLYAQNVLKRSSHA